MKPLIEQLKEKYPNIEIVVGDRTGKIFLVDDEMAIVNPFLTSCGRFEQEDLYGLSPYDAARMYAHNLPLMEDYQK